MAIVHVCIQYLASLAGIVVMFATRMKQSSETETKFVQERILHAERSFTELHLAFSSFSCRAAKLRDAGDEVSSTLQNYASSETINQCLSDGVAEFAAIFSTLNSYADKRVEYIDSKVLAQLAPYETVCKNMKVGVKDIFATKDKEVLRQRHLDRIKERNPKNRQQIVEAESELMHAKAEVSKNIHFLGEKLLSFERQKIQDLKEILLDFICTEIGYHSKVVALMTEAYASIEGIRADKDIEDLQAVFDDLDPKFKTALRSSQKQLNKIDQRVDNLGRHSKSMGMAGTPGIDGISRGIPHHSIMQTEPKFIRKQRTKSEEVLQTQDDSFNSQSVSLSDSSDSEREEKEEPKKLRKNQRHMREI